MTERPDYDESLVTLTERRMASRVCAAVAGAYCVGACILLILNWRAMRQVDPSIDMQIASMTSELATRADDEGLKNKIRQRDQELRSQYFARRAFMKQGAMLLFGGLVVTGVAVISAGRYSRRMRGPQVLPPEPPDSGRESAAARRAVWVVGGVIAGGLALAASVSLRWSAGRGSSGAVGGKGPAVIASAAEIAKNWPGFRGPTGDGVAVSVPAVDKWDGKSGEGIVWKTKVPLVGENSPVVWGGRVYLSGADKTHREVYCFDAADGRLLWQRPVGTGAGEAPDVSPDTGYAAPTVATDGAHVVAVFASGDVACFDRDGNSLWAMSLGLPESQYGYAASPVIYRDRCLIQLDQGSSADDHKSSLICLSLADGRSLWKKPRPVANSWATPLVAKVAGREQLITSGDPWVIAYDPMSGQELWQVTGLGSDLAPSPIVAGGLVIAGVANAKLMAIRPDGKGDVTTSHVAWETSEGLPDTCSPASDGKLLYLMAGDGTLTCFDLVGGAKVYEQNIPIGRASPVIIGDKIMLIDRQGVAHIGATGRTWREVATCPLGEMVDASPAIVDGRVYIRGKENLYCIGRK